MTVQPGETVLFQGTEYAEVIPVNWLPVTVGFSIDTTAKVGVDMKAHSDLEWPAALTHTWEGITRGGTGTLDATAANGIVAVDDGAAWVGVTNLELPFP